jgi:hypothetical protein
MQTKRLRIGIADLAHPANKSEIHRSEKPDRNAEWLDAALHAHLPARLIRHSPHHSEKKSYRRASKD